MLGFIILVSILLGIICWKLVSLAVWAIRAAKITANIPGPKPLPFLGNLLEFGNTRTLEDGFKRFLKLYKTYCRPPDRILKFWLGPKLVIILGNPQHIEVVLSSEEALNKDSLYKYMELMSDGVLSQNGDDWVQLRKLLNPFVTRKAIEPCLESFHEKTVKLIKLLDNKIENDQVFNIKHFIARYTFDVFFVSNFGCDINEMDVDRGLDRLFERVVELSFKMMTTFPTCLSFPYAKISKLGRNISSKSQVFWKLIYDVLQTRKKYKNLADEGVTGNATLYADMLIKKAEKENLSWVEIGKSATDYVLAGSHSVSLMSSTIILLLAMYPEHQEAVYQEQLEILGDDPEVAPTWEQLSKMTYLTRVFKEVIRLMTAPFIIRDVDNDINLGKFTIPKDSTAFIVLYSLHRDPTIWSHPEEFYPDHFLPEEKAKRPKNSYLPFSWGPRNCPGILYAITVTKILVSTLIRKYSFNTDLKFEQLTYKFSIFFDIAQGHMVKKIPRNRTPVQGA
ncbi:hypothetical protein O3M35_012548 [Rhynocoris fuscipes]|uniref:Cytochrome P450 n=1 Tax=Rhynocoris fuscipes TaxID=488301 RepID=A0AAW1CSS5_9HEMI